MDECDADWDQPSIYHKRLPTDRPDEVGRMAKAMHEDGFVLIPRVLDAATVAEARDRIDRSIHGPSRPISGAAPAGAGNCPSVVPRLSWLVEAISTRGALPRWPRWPA